MRGQERSARQSRGEIYNRELGLDFNDIEEFSNYGSEFGFAILILITQTSARLVIFTHFYLTLCVSSPSPRFPPSSYQKLAQT